MKQIAHTYTFASGSNPRKFHQALQYSDGSLSCECPGWTKRCGSDGTRTCRHVRSIQAGTAAQECVTHFAPLTLTNHTTQPRISQRAIEQPDLLTPGRRVFDLSE